MKKKAYIKKAVAAHIHQNSLIVADYSNWYVGITADPTSRFRAHGSPRLWRVWVTDHPDHARELEKHFLSQGLKGAPGGGTRPKYIYIYKHSGPYS